MTYPLKFSIIVPYRIFDDHVRECVDACRKLEAPDFSFEIILLPDSITRESDLDQAMIKTYATGPVYPAAKRNQGMRLSSAEYCAFIDADAYPKSDWLVNAGTLLDTHGNMGCVGGPNHIPPETPIRQRIGTRILYSKLGIGAFPVKTFNAGFLKVKELASSNLIVRRKILNEFGGMDTSFLTAEDAKLCFQIAKAGHIVALAPNVEVYHHRRNFPWPFIRSVYQYGHDKAWLLKEFFSYDKLYYFVPALFLLGLIFGWIIAIYFPFFRLPYFGGLIVYAVAVILQSVCFKQPIEILLGLIGIPAMHIAYGIGFIMGAFTKKQKNLKK